MKQTLGTAKANSLHPFQNIRGGPGAAPAVQQNMNSLEINIEDPRWGKLELDTLACRTAEITLRHLAFDPEICEISVLACDASRIAALNGDYREKPTPTNVLSWPADERAADTPGARPIPPQAGPDGMVELGDIALCYDTCLSEATASELAFAAHVTHLIVHGILHLLGYDHISDLDAALMEGLEVEILGKMGLHDPYSNI